MVHACIGRCAQESMRGARGARLGMDGSAARHDAGGAVGRQRDVPQQHARVDGEVVHPLRGPARVTPPTRPAWPACTRGSDHSAVYHLQYIVVTALVLSPRLPRSTGKRREHAATAAPHGAGPLCNWRGAKAARAVPGGGLPLHPRLPERARARP